MADMTLQQVDALSDEFEAALQKGDTVLIEDLLPKIDESQRPALLKELLEIEVQFVAERSASDSTIRNMQASLKKRFPKYHDVIHALFQQVSKLQRIGDYEILGELGRGGMGVVYQAKHKLLNQTVAIKVLSQNLLGDSQAVGRFKREMQLIGGLTHPNIVRALNAGEIDGMHYLAMEYVDGISLHTLVESVQARTGGVSPPLITLGAACEAIRQVALGLQNAHELKLVHRDIKPANLMIDRRGTVKILDLGLGKFAEEQRDDYHSSLTLEGMVIGTVDYISPEQCENSREADIRSDLYSLGCTLYFLLTGKPVYSGSRYDTMRKKLMAHIVGDPPSLRSMVPNLPPAIESIFQKAVAKDPAERFQTPIELAEALEPFASFDELWTLIQEVMPMDATDTRSSMRHSSPYGYVQSSRQNVVPPAKRTTRIPTSIGLIIILSWTLIAGTLYMAHKNARVHEMIEHVKLRNKASQARKDAAEHWEQWRMSEAQAEYQKAAQLAREEFDKTKLEYLPAVVTENRFQAARAQWYRGDFTRARQEMQTRLNRIDDTINQDDGSDRTLLGQKKRILECLGDFVLFGGAASGRNRERFANGISRYEEATRVPTMNSYDTIIRWKQAILLMQNGELKRAETLIQENLERSGKNPDLYQQLSEAVLFYYQSEGGTDRTQKLRTFHRQFTLQSSPVRNVASQPEVVELLLFCAEFLINDSIQHEDWRMLARDIASMRGDVANFVRQRPGAIPFVRRFCELLVQSAALVYDNTEEQDAKQRQVENIVFILDRMRPLDGEADAVSMEKSVWVYFFLPEATVMRAEPGLVVFYPPDGRPGTLYHVLWTRPMIKQRSSALALPGQLRKQIEAEKAAGRTIQVSWTDRAAWARVEDALSETEYPFRYPYDDTLPLR